MKRFPYIVILLLAAAFRLQGQTSIKVEAPNVVAIDEQFNVTFVIEGKEKEKPTGFTWSPPSGFQLVWGPQKGTSSSISIINGERTSSYQTTYTYILLPQSTGTFQIPEASASLHGETIVSSPVSIQVVSDGAQPGNQASSGGQSSGKSSGGSSGGSSTEERSQVSANGEIPSSDLFMRLSLSKSKAVVGEPITATLKLYQRVNIAGFENAKFPSFNGFWNQETYVPTNIEFKRETLDDKIYNTAVLRSYLLIPQQTGTIVIDPAELVCLVNVRAARKTSNSIFDSFFQDDYRTIRKRVVAPSVQVKVDKLPPGQPASYGGGVGNFGISARLSADEIKTHDAASIIVTVSGRGNITLLEEPKVDFPPDFEVYDTKAAENTDKGSGGISGSKSFEFPFIPRSAGDFTIEPIEYSYYDVSEGKYVTLHTQPLSLKVEKGKVSESAASTMVSSGIDRKDVKSLADDIRFISTKLPSFARSDYFLAGSPLFFIILAIMLIAAVSVWLAFRKVSAMHADVAGTKNRKAVKKARKRLDQAETYLKGNLYTAFYEELHKALTGFISDKLNMDMSDMSQDNIKSLLDERGVEEEQSKSFIDLLDACEFARYSPDAGNNAMQSHYQAAVKVILDLDSSLKSSKSKSFKAMAVFFVMMTGLGFSASAQSDREKLWEDGVQAYSDGRFSDAEECWEAMAASGEKSAALFCNLGDAFFKQGNYPKAVLCYERALKADPSYSDARYNLDHANGFVQDKIEPVPEFMLKSLARKLCYTMSSNSWTCIFLTFFAMFLAMMLLFLLGGTASSRRMGLFAGIALFLLSSNALAFALWQKSDSLKTDSAIVMSPVSSVKSSPSGKSAKDLFIIHEGTKVKIIDSVGGWDNISLADGRQGWIKSDDIEVI